MTQGKKPFENFVGKGENAGNQHFLLFQQCILSEVKIFLLKCFQKVSVIGLFKFWVYGKGSEIAKIKIEILSNRQIIWE